MAISMWVRREMAARGERLASGTVPRVPPPPELVNFRSTPLLAAVDPHGDTVFNTIQIRGQLPGEIEYLRDRLDDPGRLMMLDELARLAELALARVHRYLWFVGV